MTTPTAFRISAVIRIAADAEYVDHQCFVSDYYPSGSKRQVSVFYAGLWFNVMFLESGEAYKVTLDVARVNDLVPASSITKANIDILV